MKNNFLVAILIIVAILTILFLGWPKEKATEPRNNTHDQQAVNNAKKEIKKILVNVDELPIENLKHNTNDYLEWKTYRNEETGIEIKYPAEWKFWDDENLFGNKNSIVVFGASESYAGGGTWGVNFLPDKKSLYYSEVYSIYDHWEDRKQEITAIDLNSEKAVYVITSNDSWEFKHLYLFTEKGAYLFWGEGEDFLKFYSSFKSIN